MMVIIEARGEDNSDGKYVYEATAYVHDVVIGQETSETSYQEAIGKLILKLQDDLEEIWVDTSEFVE